MKNLTLLFLILILNLTLINNANSGAVCDSMCRQNYLNNNLTIGGKSLACGGANGTPKTTIFGSPGFFKCHCSCANGSVRWDIGGF